MIAAKRKAVVTHPTIQEVCELLDIQLMIDGVDVAPEGDEQAQMRTVWMLGWPQELNAGIRSGEVTPWFFTMDELEAFCVRHLEKFRAHAIANPDGPVPDATGWDKN